MGHNFHLFLQPAETADKKREMLGSLSGYGSAISVFHFSSKHSSSKKQLLLKNAPYSNFKSSLFNHFLKGSLFLLPFSISVSMMQFCSQQGCCRKFQSLLTFNNSYETLKYVEQSQLSKLIFTLQKQPSFQQIICINQSNIPFLCQ